MSEGLLVVCPHCDSINRVPPSKLNAGGKCGRCKQPLFAGRPLTLSGTGFDQHVSRGDLPVLVDFWAPWCGPCKMMAPVFEQAAAELEPQVRVAKVNTETEQALAMRFGIRSIPTIALFKGGREVARTAGAMGLRNLLAWVRKHL